MSGDEALVAFITRLRKLGTLGADAAKLAAPLVEKAARATAEAGTAPDGTPWTPKKDGGRPLVNAAKALSAKAIGTTVVLTLTGVEVLHNFGSKRNPKRQILPDGGAGIPPNIAKALHEGASHAFARAMGGQT